MFSQMLHYLTMREQVNTEAQEYYSGKDPIETARFPNLISHDKVQQVIFDESYMSFLS